MEGAIPRWAKKAEFDKAWLYRQGIWELVEDPHYEFYNELGENTSGSRSSYLEEIGYDEQGPIVYEIADVVKLSIYRKEPVSPYDDTPLEPRYPFYVTLDLAEASRVRFYLADEPSYIQILPHLLDIVERTGRLRKWNRGQA